MHYNTMQINLHIFYSMVFPTQAQCVRMDFICAMHISICLIYLTMHWTMWYEWKIIFGSASIGIFENEMMVIEF